MEALKANKIIGSQNDGRAVFLFLPNLPGKKGFKFHAQPQTGPYSCWFYSHVCVIFLRNFRPTTRIQKHDET